jgi:hypothetical protein
MARFVVGAVFGLGYRVLTESSPLRHTRERGLDPPSGGLLSGARPRRS